MLLFNVECPNCGENFIPHMENRPMGKNTKGNNVFVFFQLCSLCHEPVIGFKEGNKDKQWFEPTDTEDLVILKQGQ
jgi:phage terminase large subunit GpA-like protein